MLHVVEVLDCDTDRVAQLDILRVTHVVAEVDCETDRVPQPEAVLEGDTVEDVEVVGDVETVLFLTVGDAVCEVLSV